MKIGWVRELFSFTKIERSGIIGLLIIIFILILIGKLIPLFIPHQKTDTSKWDAEVLAWLAKEKTPLPRQNLPWPSVIDPNEVDSVRLSQMGLPSNVRSNWLKYLEKGGRFNQKEEVRKIFGMTASLWEQLDPYLVIAPGRLAKVKASGDRKRIKSGEGVRRDTVWKRNSYKKEAAPVIVQELNSADSVHLVEIPGIGPVFASRIIRYRNLLGGYYAVSQLREVFGMKEENFAAVSPYLKADQKTITQFNINFSTLKELGRHPYIGFRTARKIIQLKDKEGKFTEAQNLSKVLSADSLNKLIPYLKFSEN